MSTNNTYLAVFLGSATGPRRAAWDGVCPRPARPTHDAGHLRATPGLRLQPGPERRRDARCRREFPAAERLALSRGRQARYRSPRPPPPKLLAPSTSPVPRSA